MAKVTKLNPPKTRTNLQTPTDIAPKGVEAIAAAINKLICDAFTLYVKTKNFHWHLSGPHFRDYHLMLDEQGDQIYASIDPLAERVRKLGATTVRSIAQIKSGSSLEDNEANFVSALDMLAELMSDNKATAKAMRAAHAICDEHDDVGTASLLENLIDEAERRTWFLFEATRAADRTGH